MIYTSGSYSPERPMSSTGSSEGSPDDISSQVASQPPRLLPAHENTGMYEHRGALRGTPGSAYPQPEPNATELPSSAPGRPELIELQASAPSPTPTRAEEHIATTPDCRPRAPAPSPTPTRAGHLSGLQIVRLRALARRRAPKRTPHFTCRCERGTLHMKRWECLEHGRPQPRCCRCR